MKKIAICACSNAGLDYLDYPKDIRIMRSTITFKDGISHDDFTGIDSAAFYTHLENDAEDIPKTAYVSLGTMMETFDTLRREGYTDVIFITISNRLSGLYNAVCQLAIDMEPGLVLHPFDSKTLAYPQAYMALEAHRMAAEGKDVEEIIKRLEHIRDNDEIIFAVDTLVYLVKNGRLSKMSGSIGNFLKVKPLMRLSEDGAVEPIEKIRTTSKAHKRVLEKYFEETEGKDVITSIIHAHNEVAAREFEAAIKAVHPEREVVTAYLTPVVGAHAGPGAIAVGYVKK